MLPSEYAIIERELGERWPDWRPTQLQMDDVRAALISRRLDDVQWAMKETWLARGGRGPHMPTLLEFARSREAGKPAVKTAPDYDWSGSITLRDWCESIGLDRGASLAERIARCQEMDADRF